MAKNNIHQTARRNAIEAAASKVEEEQAALEEVDSPKLSSEALAILLSEATEELDAARERFNNASPEEKDALSSETQELLDKVERLQAEFEASEDEANGELV